MATCHAKKRNKEMNISLLSMVSIDLALAECSMTKLNKFRADFKLGASAHKHAHFTVFIAVINSTVFS